MTTINIMPVDARGVRWVRVKTDNGQKCLGGYDAEGAEGQCDSLRFALTMALSWKRQRSKRAVIVLKSPSEPSLAIPCGLEGSPEG